MNQADNDFDWNDFAVLHSSVMTSVQLEMYKTTAKYLKGSVADCGCGTAKITPFLADISAVTTYTGIDCSPEMIQQAKHMVAKLSSRIDVHFFESFIEDVGQKFDSALSLQSYYSWPAPEKTLAHIYSMLNAGAHFILASPNPELNMPLLLEEAEKELIGHPFWADFKDHNQALADHDNSHFIRLDALITQLKNAGFEIIEAHSHFYLGGLNFIVAQNSQTTST
ncbi:MAG: methyltransferase domain-containing protein [Pseudomonadales bacterium]|nr:methyltransferase domain-containing protein [Pseudomonadales bacterium]